MSSHKMDVVEVFPSQKGLPVDGRVRVLREHKCVGFSANGGVLIVSEKGEPIEPVREGDVFRYLEGTRYMPVMWPTT